MYQLRSPKSRKNDTKWKVTSALEESYAAPGSWLGTSAICPSKRAAQLWPVIPNFRLPSGM